MKPCLFTLGIFVAIAASGSGAQAQNYPWCAVYGSVWGGGAQNCGFTTFAQCMATVSGIGGYCNVNTQYQPSAPSSRAYAASPSSRAYATHRSQRKRPPA